MWPSSATSSSEKVTEGEQSVVFFPFYFDWGRMFEFLTLVRRRGFRRQMMKAAEDLVLRMGCEDMYLHVRIIDTAPLAMYKVAGYQVVSTNSLLSVIKFGRRFHLMCKRLSRS